MWGRGGGARGNVLASVEFVFGQTKAVLIRNVMPSTGV